MLSNQRGQVELFNRRGKGIVLAYEQDKQLYSIWEPLEWTKEVQTSIVPCFFKQTRTGAKLILEHSVFPNTVNCKLLKMDCSICIRVGESVSSMQGDIIYQIIISGT
jgi:hypothetical protein